METDYQKIRNTIEEALKSGKRNFIIYPYGEYGMLTKTILNHSFGVKECYVADNRLSLFNPQIKELDYFETIDTALYTVLLTSANPSTYDDVRKEIARFFNKEDIIDIFPKEVQASINTGGGYTQCGKYSYGPLCNHRFVESVGAFCSFAGGSDVVENHPTGYISTHPFLYADSEMNPAFWYRYDECKDAAWYFPDVKPKGIAGKLFKVKIGNDVWLGRNVIITNGANIGNGVIAGAGAVITRDVPDYAVVVGVPARIIRYRYTREQIEKLNAIAWWTWSDQDIRDRYDDFYLSADDFILKYYK